MRSEGLRWSSGPPPLFTTLFCFFFFRISLPSNPDSLVEQILVIKRWVSTLRLHPLQDAPIAQLREVEEEVIQIYCVSDLVFFA